MRYWWTFLAVGLLLLGLHNLAHAQQLDPRLVGPAIAALQADQALKDAIIQAQRDDAVAREKALAEWFKAWFGEPAK